MNWTFGYCNVQTHSNSGDLKGIMQLCFFGGKMQEDVCLEGYTDGIFMNDVLLNLFANIEYQLFD